MESNKINSVEVCTIGEEHYKTIFEAICDKTGHITKMDIISHLKDNGITRSDPRIKNSTRI